MIDLEVLRIINASFAIAKDLLTQYRKQLDALASALLVRETLGEADILDVTGLPPAPELESRPLPATADAPERNATREIANV
jgi:cell division protease FtsH